MRLQQGSIIWATVADSAGRNAKRRPAVVVTPTAEIKAGEPMVAVAATSSFDASLPPNLVELPWHRSRHPRTGLSRRCAAVCDWLLEIDPSRVEAIGGVVPSAVLAEILARLPSIPRTPPFAQGDTGHQPPSGESASD